ncbi:MAG: AtpZ/AtpI family protein [Bacteroidetes bacterium]|nr:AtpZ/AtpI family protein [Bacteroidota bacterium]
MTDKKGNLKSYIRYSSLGFQIIGFMAIFGYLGFKTDNYFKFKTPYLTILGLVFGVVGSMIYVIRDLTKKND